MSHGKVRVQCIWIFLFAALAAPLWPQPIGLVSMGLSIFFVIYQAVLVYDLIDEARIDNMDPYEYERYCAGLLMKMRWRVELTKASHDQGADIIATKRGMRVVFQCKKYTRPVGNHAVQQIVAAIAHEQAQRGAVVATRPFTSAAVKLAASNSILLLHHSQLPRLDYLLKSANSNKSR